MPDDGRLSINITHSDGRVTRLGPDEVDAANVPMGLTFSSSLPGGFKDCSLQLLVRIDLETPIELLDDVSIIGPGGDVAWEGRITQLPRSHGDSFGMTPGAVGWSAHLSDDPSFTEVYVDRDWSAWGDTAMDRKVALLGLGISMGDFSWTTSNQELIVTLPNQALGANTIAETMYRMPAGRTISKVMYRGATAVPGGWTHSIRVGADTAFSLADTYTATLDDTLRTVTATTARRYGLIQLYSNGTAATPASGSLARYSKVGVYGNHGLTTRTISDEPDGVYASDVIAHVLTNAAPELTYTTGTDGSIQSTTFAIPHLVFGEPGAGEDAILFVNAYHQWEWGVFENREFFFRPTDPDRCLWEARLSEGAHLDLEGQTAGDTYNGVFVDYTDTSGARSTVGPPGASADATSASLADTSEDNPVNSHGITRKWARMSISQVTTQAGATQLGAIWLAEQAIPQRRGSVRVTGSIRHSTRGLRPAWAVRAGDYVRIADHPTDVARRIIATNYDHSSRTITMDVGSQSQKLVAILERLNIASVGRY